MCRRHLFTVSNCFRDISERLIKNADLFIWAALIENICPNSYFDSSIFSINNLCTVDLLLLLFCNFPFMIRKTVVFCFWYETSISKQVIFVLLPASFVVKTFPFLQVGSPARSCCSPWCSASCWRRRRRCRWTRSSRRWSTRSGAWSSFGSSSRPSRSTEVILARISSGSWRAKGFQNNRTTGLFFVNEYRLIAMNRHVTKWRISRRGGSMRQAIMLHSFQWNNYHRTGWSRSI